MMELLTDPLLFEAYSGYLNLEYPVLLKFLLQSGKLTCEMVTKISTHISKQHQIHAAQYEKAIESRNYWSAPSSPALKVLQADAQHDLDIESLYEYRLGKMIGVISNHLAQTSTA
jgi:hypothetical protein